MQVHGQQAMDAKWIVQHPGSPAIPSILSADVAADRACDLYWAEDALRGGLLALAVFLTNRCLNLLRRKWPPYELEAEA